MEEKYEPNYSLIDEIYIKDIIFEKDSSSTAVTLFAYYYNIHSKSLVRVDYWCEFSMLTDLLLAAKQDGEPIIKAITERLSDNEPEYPSLIDVEDILGEPLKITGIILTIYKPMEKDDDGEWKENDEAFYIIDSIEEKEIFEERKSTPGGLQEQFSDYLILLENAYQYYMQLLDIDLTEKVARKKAGLKDELLFRMAVINHQIINL